MQISAQDVFTAINKVRESPNLVLNQIKQQLKRFESNSVYRNKKDVKVRTLTGKAGWQDTVLAIQRQKHKASLAWNPLLQKAAEQYADVAKQDSSINPFQIIKSICQYEQTISFNINQSDTQQDTIQLVAAMIVGDGDEKKGSRVAIFHPLYKQFACSVRKSGNKNIIYTIFAQSVKENTGSNQQKQNNNKNDDAESKSAMSWNDMLLRKNPQSKAEKYKSQKQELSRQDYIKRGKQLIAELNKVRKQPKQYVHALKSQIDKFKDDKILAADYGQITTKEGTIPYYDLISQLQAQYPLPTIREVSGLSIVAMEQVLQQQSSLIQSKAPIAKMLDKFCESVDGVRSMKLREINGMPIQALLMRLLVGDGDRKRTGRRKMLSPVCKAMGCCISRNMLVANVADTAKDLRPAVQEYFSRLSDEPKSANSSSSPWKSQKSEYSGKKTQQNSVFSFNSNNNRNQMVNINMNGDRVVIKKTSKSHNQSKAGRIYRITEIQVIYNDGQIEKIIEEQLLK